VAVVVGRSKPRLRTYPVVQPSIVGIYYVDKFVDAADVQFCTFASVLLQWACVRILRTT